MATKKWTAKTLIRQIDLWTEAVYGDHVVGAHAGDVRSVDLGQFIEDVKSHEFEESLRQVPGQQQARSDKEGNITIADHDAPQEPEPAEHADPRMDPDAEIEQMQQAGER